MFPIDQRSQVKSAVIYGISLAICLRVVLGIVMAAAWLAVEAHISPPPSPALYGNLQMPTSRLGQLLLGVWVRWDAVHYLNLAMVGYFGVSPGDSVFYPLFAGVTRLVARAFGGHLILASLVVSTVSTAASLTFMFLLGGHIFSPSSGRWATVGFAVYPTALFLVAPFSESLFLALTLGAMYFAYRDKWILSCALAFFASLTRGPGMFLSVPLAMIAVDRIRAGAGEVRCLHAASISVAVAAPLAAGFGFLVWRPAVGFLSMTEAEHKYAGLSFVDPVTGLASALRQWVVIHDLPTTLDTFSALLFIAVTVCMIFNARWRRIEMVAYMVVTLVLFLMVRVADASSLRSLSRYVLTLFPAFLVWGDFLANIRPRVRFLLLVASSSSLILLSALYALWFFVG